MRLTIHPTHPQDRHITHVANIIRKGGVVIFPTDSAYAIGCQLGNKEATARIRAIRQIDKNHFFTLCCRDLSELSTYARVDNWVFRLIKNNTPGAYTFLLNATSEVPKLLLHAKRKTIGLRIPDHPATLALLNELDTALMSVSLILPGEKEPLWDPDDIAQRLERQVDFILDAGSCGFEPTTVVDLTGDAPIILREGKGEIDAFANS